MYKESLEVVVEKNEVKDLLSMLQSEMDNRLEVHLAYTLLSQHRGQIAG